VLKVELARPRNRLELSKDAKYMSYRQNVIEFLYSRHAKPSLELA
jgi:nitrate/nitrite transport system ATP-binding protein